MRNYVKWDLLVSLNNNKKLNIKIIKIELNKLSAPPKQIHLSNT